MLLVGYSDGVFRKSLEGRAESGQGAWARGSGMEGRAEAGLRSIHATHASFDKSFLFLCRAGRRESKQNKEGEQPNDNDIPNKN